MNIKLRLLTFTLLTFSAGASALCAEDRIRVEVPGVEQSTLQTVHEPQPRISGRLDFQISSWAPNDFWPQSHQSIVSRRQETILPELSAYYRFSPTLYSVHISIGFSAFASRRIGSMPVNGGSENLFQTAYLFSVPSGFFVEPEQIEVWKIRPFIGGYLLPSLSTAQQSAFARGGTKFHLPFGCEAGLIWEPSFLVENRTSFVPVGFLIGFEATGLSLVGSDLSSAAIRGGLRLTL